MSKPELSDCRLVISCGGTGGHFFPGLSVARTLQDNGGEVLLLISGVNAEKQCATAQKFGIRSVELPKMPSPNRPKKALQFLHGLYFGTRRAKREIAAFRPSAALGMGSFASLPVLAAAKFSGVPIFLHDGNARVGKANRILSRFACWLGTAFPAVNAERVHCRCEHSGMPLRPEILGATQYTKEQAVAELNHRFHSALLPEKPTILIFGGSQGAATLNSNVPQALRKIGNRNFQVLHLAGPDKIAEVLEAYAGAPFPVLALPGTDAMELFYHAADLVISRSGGSTLAELLYFGKPALLVPYPYAAEGHQWDNARYALEHDAAVAIDNSQCSVEHVFELLSEFLEHSSVWQKRAENARRLARPDAAETLLERIRAHESKS